MNSIKLINHSSLIISDGIHSIITDPYLSGSCFNNGWDLIVETNTPIEKLDFDYIWLSHEHPDHFSPRDLLRISKKKRNGITIIYQKTNDKKVVKYCKSKGFKIKELSDYEEFKISKNFSIIISQHRDSDSWSLFKIGKVNILNLNDCFIFTKDKLQDFKKRFGSIDILLTQFSFANWIGNIGDKKKSVEMSKWHLNKFKTQVDFIKPKYVIPFASFVFFSNEENYYLNKYSVKIKDVINILEKSESIPIILYPNERWSIGENHKNINSTDKWNNAYNNIKNKKLRSINSKSIEDIKKIFNLYQDRIKRKNSFSHIKELKKEKKLQKTFIRVTDLENFISFDIVDGLEVLNHLKEDRIDIYMSSDSLYYLLKNEWGRGTLQINGRFQAGGDGFINFIKQTQIAFANNIQKFYPESIAYTEILNPRNFVLSVHNNKVDSHT